MFVNLMRSNQRWLMIVISTLVIISFIIFYGNRTSYDRLANDKAGTIYGRGVSSTEFDRTVRQIQTAEELGLVNIVDPDLTSSRDLNEVVANNLVMQHQADELGVLPSNDEVKAAWEKLTVFQGPGGQFDPVKYTQFVTEKLNPRGFTEAQLEDLVRTDLQFGKVHQLINAGVILSPTEMRAAYDTEYARTDASVVRFKSADFAAAINPTDDEIKKYYDEQKDKFQAPEKRKVQYVVFGLDDTQKKLFGKPRMDALKPKADAAADFQGKLLDAEGKSDFATVAKAQNLTVQETPEFEENVHTGFPEAAVPGFTAAAFHLSQKNPDSDVPLQTPPGRMPEAYYVLHLAAVVPARPLTLDEAKSKVVEALKADRARTALTAKAEEIRTKIAAALKEGRSILDAAKEAGTSAQDVPDFSLAEPDTGATPDASIISETSMELGAGELSKFVTTPDGGLLVYVRGRKAVSDEKFNKDKEQLATSMETQKKRFFFYEWLRSSREAAGANLNANPNLRG